MGLKQAVCMLLAVLALLISITTAENTASNITAASTFYLARTQTQFSVNIANDSQDVFIYFASPAYSWVGVGFGHKMAGSLMFIMYNNKDGSNVTISPRIGSAASEPTFNSSIDLTVLPGTWVNDSMLMLNARCSNCRSFIDTKSSTQPMIYAFGDGQNVMSNSPSAPLQRHVRYGFFTMNMLTATGPGGVPASSSAMNGVAIEGSMVRDHDRANLAHAVFGCLAVLIFWPMNVLAVTLFKNIKIHVVFSVLIMVLLIVSFALGGVISGQYNRSKAFNSPHQITAFLTILPLLLTSILPALTHLTTKVRALHTPLTSISFVLLVLTGGLGLRLSMQPTSLVLVYTGISIGVFIVLLILHTCLRKRGSAYARAQNRRPRSDTPDSPTTEEMLIMAKMHDSQNTAGLNPPPPYYPQQGYHSTGSAEFGADGQHVHPAQHSRSSSRTRQFGGGAMPGPQYLLNMHPGVPVQVGRL
ncbi:uncharacterized protein SETTUDRAFT_20077 [Exserohilum turcica Et28A]|uniref:DOMON domain-containing protein n=1 Tax=Exserohilum turcicum (strain 28A) TaxID=671987 RepID=R0IH62_EXST2|nr:uncharacterized protein SETTUDRAFT_20077 [Exserohilum turcica Et28A]EOA84535.1 hypothetical protein SETTUDRAFT_20077 [Exserohilum turcica Et28A]